MVLPRTLLLRRLRPSASTSLLSPRQNPSTQYIHLPIRTIGTSNLHAPENSFPNSSRSPSSQLSPSTSSRMAAVESGRLAVEQTQTPPTLPTTTSASSTTETTNLSDGKSGKKALSNKDYEATRGNLSSNSIFTPTQSKRPRRPATNEEEELETSESSSQAEPLLRRNLLSIAPSIDPKPSTRRRWERKMTIRSIQTRNRLSKAQIIKRTEREITSKSDFLRTSIKKLQPLARQIAGKSLEDAIVQMRFSKKKNAIAIRKHLEEARDKAIVERGMGLGKAEGRIGERVVIRTKDGDRKVISDRTGIYIAQAWVGKGTYGMDVKYRARGRANMLRLPQTSLSVLLKEEATLVREHNEREARAARRRVWTPLRDRPLHGQRPYYSW